MKKKFFPLYLLHYIWSRVDFFPENLLSIPFLIIEAVTVGFVLPFLFLIIQVVWFFLSNDTKEFILDFYDELL